MSVVPTVLVVEDDAAVRRAIRRSVLMEGYDFHGCTTAEEGIAYLRTARPPCLVVLDLSLPGMHGVDFIRWVAAQHRLRDVRMAIVSASAHMFAQLAPFRDHIVVRVLEKPFDMTHLVEVLHQNCRSAMPANDRSRG